MKLRALSMQGIFWVVLLALNAAVVAESGQGDLLFPNSDFEIGDLTNWRMEGEAFQHQPTLGDNALVRVPGNGAQPQGQYWAGTYERYQGKENQKPGDSQGNKPQGGLLSTGFVIEKPYIGFLMSGGSTEETAVQLIVNGLVTHTATGANHPLMHRVFWDVSGYQGEKAMIYLIDRSSAAWGCVNADDFRYYERPQDLLLFPNSDFELGDLTNWTAEGEAFAHQPTKGDNVAARMGGAARANHEGHYWVGTYEHFQGKADETPGTTQGDAPKGVLRSIPFTLQGKTIMFRIGGGTDENLSVRLLVEGNAVRTARGDRNEEMQYVVWDVSRYESRSVEIEVVDNSSKAWGHINVDEFRYVRRD